MNTYRIVFHVHGHVDLQADSEQEALRKFCSSDGVSSACLTEALGDTIECGGNDAIYYDSMEEISHE